MLWNRGCRLPWRQQAQRGENIRWDEQKPTQIRLNPGKVYMVQYTLNVCAMHASEEAGVIFLRQTPCSAFTETLPLYVPMKQFTGSPQTLRYTAVLYPRMEGGTAELSLALDAKNALCVEQAVMSVVEL